MHPPDEDRVTSRSVALLTRVGVGLETMKAPFSAFSASLR
jgi:hypothetical protein